MPRPFKSPMDSPSPPPPLDLNALSDMDTKELRAIWPRHMGKAPMPRLRRILLRELGWRYQEKLYGGFDPETKKLLDAAVRAAQKKRLWPLGTERPSDEALAEDALKPRRRTKGVHPSTIPVSKLPTGAKLIRNWPIGSKVHHEVTVLKNGQAFMYKGKEYKTLSEIARLITGSRWSGPRFFGLVRKTKRPSDHHERSRGAGGLWIGGGGRGGEVESGGGGGGGA